MTENVVMTMVQQDNLVVKIHLQVSSDESNGEKFPFTLDDVASTVVEMTEPIYSAVNTAVDPRGSRGRGGLAVIVASRRWA
ncbi:MAG TPA: hypothetical protein VIP77_11935 [Jiangellaceae bacterium]